MILSLLIDMGKQHPDFYYAQGLSHRGGGKVDVTAVRRSGPGMR